MAKARARFEQALVIEPGYAPVHSALAEHDHTQYIMGFDPVQDPRCQDVLSRMNLPIRMKTITGAT